MMIPPPKPVAWRVEGGEWCTDGIDGQKIDVPGPIAAMKRVEVTWDGDTVHVWIEVPMDIGPRDTLRFDQTKFRFV